MAYIELVGRPGEMLKQLLKINEAGNPACLPLFLSIPF